MIVLVSLLMLRDSIYPCELNKEFSWKFSSEDQMENIPKKGKGLLQLKCCVKNDKDKEKSHIYIYIYIYIDINTVCYISK